jgi:hypothetical protein
MRFIICGNVSKSDEDIKIYHVDEFGHEVFGTL